MNKKILTPIIVIALIIIIGLAVVMQRNTQNNLSATVKLNTLKNDKLQQMCNETFYCNVFEDYNYFVSDEKNVIRYNAKTGEVYQVYFDPNTSVTEKLLFSKAPKGTYQVEIPLIGNFDNDGLPDIAFYRYDTNKLYIFLSSKQYIFNQADIVEYGFSSWENIIKLQDINKDGISDIISYRDDNSYDYKIIPSFAK